MAVLFFARLALSLLTHIDPPAETLSASLVNLVIPFASESRLLVSGVAEKGPTLVVIEHNASH